MKTLLTLTAAALATAVLSLPASAEGDVGCEIGEANASYKATDCDWDDFRSFLIVPSRAMAARASAPRRARVATTNAPRSSLSAGDFAGRGYPSDRQGISGGAGN